MEFEEQENLQPQQPPIAIYSKWAILGFSIFFSPFIGCILMMLNLRAIGKPKVGYLVVILGIVYVFIAEIILLKLLGIPFASVTPQKLMANPKTIYYSKALDILGAAILTEYFFRRYFQDDQYESKSIWVPLLVMLLLSFALGGLI
ncbi:MAG TPA: hypothetical protein VFE54_04365 [Mucilaginibacter sp.]|jgi:hypothetical protein|nr:hypothetical protein [Mucilaginibacter sp.]